MLMALARLALAVLALRMPMLVSMATLAVRPKTVTTVVALTTHEHNDGHDGRCDGRDDGSHHDHQHGDTNIDGNHARGSNADGAYDNRGEADFDDAQHEHDQYDVCDGRDDY